MPNPYNFTNAKISLLDYRQKSHYFIRRENRTVSLTPKTLPFQWRLKRSTSLSPLSIKRKSPAHRKAILDTD